jgi:imidazole glycerol-phosphate synthase subunit HisF
MPLEVAPRVIPVLQLSEGGLVKTVRFSSPRYIGDPINTLRIFNDKEVDEILVLDISASKSRKLPDFALLERMASEAFMPLTYAGGINSFEVAETVFRLGFDKIGVETLLRSSPTTVSRLADVYGEQSMIGMISVREWFGRPVLHHREGGKGVWAKLQELNEANIGEIMFNFAHLEGTRLGMPLGLIEEASGLTSKPIIATGGIGSLQDIQAAVAAGASGVGVGSFFCLQGERRGVLISYLNNKELTSLLDASHS